MGLFFSRPPEVVSVGAPPLRTPFTDITAPVGHHDYGKCLPYNLRFIDCMEAYGPVKGRSKCAEVYQDYLECAKGWKRMHRIDDIKEERLRQWLAGVTGKGPKVPLFAENPPNRDSFVPDFIMDEP